MYISRIHDVEVADTVAHYLIALAKVVPHNYFVTPDMTNAAANLCFTFVNDVFDFTNCPNHHTLFSISIAGRYFSDMRHVPSNSDPEASDREEFESAKLLVQALREEGMGYHVKLDAAILKLHAAINENE